MMRYITAAMFALLATTAIAQPSNGRYVEPPTDENGYAIVLTFDAIGGKEGTHSHWFVSATKVKTMAECEDLALGEEGDHDAAFAAAVITSEKDNGYTVKNIDFDCHRLTPEAAGFAEWKKDAGTNL